MKIASRFRDFFFASLPKELPFHEGFFCIFLLTQAGVASAQALENEGSSDSEEIACDSNNRSLRFWVVDSLVESPVRNARVQMNGTAAGAANALGYLDVQVPIEATTARFEISASDYRRQTLSLSAPFSCETLRIELISNLWIAEEAELELRAQRGSTEAAIEARRESTGVQDGVSAEEIRRSSDSDAGQAARRIVGASIVGGQYIFVRGLGGRYISTTLNGASMPSTDPDQPGVQLDLFPSSMLDGLTLAKTFSADLPGDSSGGSLQLSTRSFPDRFGMSLSLSLGANTETTFSSAPMGPAGSLDFLGLDDGGRQIPSGAPRNMPLVPSTNLPVEEVVARSRTFARTLAIQNGTALPSGRIGLQLGDTLRVGGRRLGYILNLSYGNSSQVLRNERLTQVYVANPDTGEIGELPARQRTSWNNSIALGALGSMNLALADDSSIGLTALVSQAADSYTGSLTGYDQSQDVNTRQTRIRYVDRTLAFAQLSGDHQGLPFGLRFRWQVSGSMGGRSEPDTRDMLYVANVGSNDYYWRNTPGSGERLFLGLNQREIGAGGDFTLPLRGELDGTRIRFGGALRQNERDFSLRRFFYAAGRGFDPSQATLPPEQLFAPENLNANLYLRETTGSKDSYFANQGLAAAFLLWEGRLASFLRINAGARAEAFRQVVRSESPFSNGSSGNNLSDESINNNLDVLPAVGVIFDLSEDVDIRLNYGGTVARPSVRELAPFLYPDFIRVRNIFGNPNLKRTFVHNFDLRGEWFPSRSEVFAISAFAKAFEQPIEMVAYANNTFSYDNAQSALNLGLEGEARVALRRLHPILEGLEGVANLTVVFSEVSLSPEQRGQTTSLRRPLAGQSPYILNLQLGYAVPGTSLSIRALYNVFGPRILEVGRQLLPDVVQEPFHSLDITASLGLGSGFELRAAAENVFLDDYVLTQNGLPVQSYNAGLSAQLSIGWREH